MPVIILRNVIMQQRSNTYYYHDTITDGLSKNDRMAYKGSETANIHTQQYIANTVGQTKTMPYISKVDIAL